MRKRPAAVSLRTTEEISDVLNDTAKMLRTTKTKVMETGIILARRHFQRWGTLNLNIGARNGDNTLL